ncbi:tetratricopeptide repeat protein [Ferrimonas senticii]|uniref:tetratricopeptide repeat protein n=1 Tax=Ferrimonas senticii TaxID=394566 RepID=UPI00041224C6|nr:tetratricopeptide repeat protein [Ferrimonas senticii]
MLTFAIAALLLLLVTPLWWRWQQCGQAVTVRQQADIDSANTRRPSGVALLLLLALIGGSSIGAYSQLGRFGDYQLQVIDNAPDYLQRERLQSLALQASTPAELAQLAQAYAELNQYDQAAATMARLLSLSAASSHALALQAKFSYYRDGRVLNADTQLLISRSLALNPAEPEALLLLANHAYLQGEYAQALEHWQRLIDAAPASLELAPIQRAMAKANAKLAAAAPK